MLKHKCDFCGTKIDGKIVLKDLLIQKTNGSEIILCGDCLNLYANQQYKELTNKVRK